MSLLGSYASYKSVKSIVGGRFFRPLLALALIPIGRNLWRRWQSRSGSKASQALEDIRRSA